MPGETGVAQAMAGRGDLTTFGVPSGFKNWFAVRAKCWCAELDEAHAAIASDGQLGMITIMRHVVFASSHAWIMVVGMSLPDQSA